VSSPSSIHSAPLAATSKRCATPGRPTLPFLSLSLSLSHDTAAHQASPSATAFRRGDTLDGQWRGRRNAQAWPPPERHLNLDGRQTLQQRRRPRVWPSASPAVQDRLGPGARAVAAATAQVTRMRKATTTSSRLGTRGSAAVAAAQGHPSSSPLSCCTKAQPPGIDEYGYFSFPICA
jgi:hypothetical protein